MAPHGSDPVGWDVFLSYSRDDVHAADRIQTALERAYRRLDRALRREGALRLEIVRDETHFELTRDLHGYIRERVRRSQNLLVLCSPSARQSQWIADVEIPAFHEFHGATGREPLYAWVRGELPFRETSLPRPGDSDDPVPLAADFRGLQTPRLRFSAMWRLPSDDPFTRETYRVLAALLGHTPEVLLARQVRVEQRRRVLVVALVAGLLLLFAAIGQMALAAAREARAGDLAERAAQSLQRDATRALELAEASLEVAPTSAGYRAWFAARNHGPIYRDVARAGALPFVAVAVTRDARHVGAATRSGELFFFDVETLELRGAAHHRFEAQDALLMLVPAGGDGWWSISANGSLYRWSPDGTQGLALGVEGHVVGVDTMDDELLVWTDGVHVRFDLRRVVGVPLATSEAAVLGRLRGAGEATLVTRDGAVHTFAADGSLVRTRRFSRRVLVAASDADEVLIAQIEGGAVERLTPDAVAPEQVAQLEDRPLTMFVGGDELIVGVQREDYRRISFERGHLPPSVWSDEIFVAAHAPLLRPDAGRLEEQLPLWVVANTTTTPSWIHGPRVGELIGHQGLVLDLAITPTRIFTAGEDARLLAWEMGEVLARTARLSSRFVGELACHDEVAVAAGHRGPPVVLGARSFAQKELDGCKQTNVVKRIGDRVFVGCESGAVLAIDEHGTSTEAWRSQHPVVDLTGGLDGAVMVLNEGGLVALPAATRIPLPDGFSRPLALAPLEDGAWLVHGTHTTATVISKEGAEQARFSDVEAIAAHVVSLANTRQISRVAANGALTPWDVYGRPLAWIGDLLAVASLEGPVELVDAHGRAQLRLDGHPREVRAIVRTSGGPVAYWTVADDGLLRGWTEQGEVLIVEHAHARGAYQLCMSGPLLISGGQDGMLRGWLTDPASDADG